VSPRVSVISLVYKNAPHLLDAFPDLEAQRLRDFEQVLLDNGSPDDAATIEREWCARRPWARLLHSPTNLGICRGLNEAARHATGEFLAFFTDDRWAPDHLERAVEALDRAGPKAAAFFCPADEYTPATGRRVAARPEQSLTAPHHAALYALFQVSEPTVIRGSDMVRALLAGNLVPAVSIVMRRAVFLALGGYDESLPIEDYEMSLRISLEHDWVYSPVASATYVAHKESYSVRFPAVVAKGAAVSVLKHRGALARRGLENQVVAAVYAAAMRGFSASVAKRDRKSALDSLKLLIPIATRLRGRHLASLARAMAGLSLRQATGGQA
jgi:GT2 family glycosyltransferase